MCSLQHAIYKLKKSPCTYVAKFNDLLSTFGSKSFFDNFIMLTKKTRGDLSTFAIHVNGILLI